MIDLIILVTLLALGYGFGSYAESRHYKSIIARENRLRHIPAVTSRFPPMNNNSRDAELVSGSVVISVDYFKRFIAALRNLVGGRVTSYESLVDRARREAILRMKAQAEQCNADIVFNVKLETSSIHKGRGNSIGSVEVLAYGTALKTQQ
ncbi:MAG: YbjQ family protein [Candidatus Thiodiazotropha taylori]|nr:YbjQ family protein [Candidatus Thiodiazotropha taylori]MCG8079817.1 YbjQ family protein [Candidatus Thiodiazotropha taylori]MCG8105930.1 YbjQ family protein [Candidatus Thiodiazotropha taylori]MCG8112141.1 YbjQ family protein [Candidatus Thiodiazotropha taylori]MCG8122958.1 YbjQ family protein [Candidatus Thiodiazotropha taylori]